MVDSTWSSCVHCGAEVVEIIQYTIEHPNTICDEAEQLWATYLKTQNEQDRQNYLNHVLSHDEDFADLKKLKEYREGLESE
jgi:hypothetical protein